MLIIGCGRLGASLANEIYSQGNDVCILDQDREAFRKLDSSYGGLTETADATDLEALTGVRAQKADCIILVTDNDNVNIMTAQIASVLFHTEKSYAAFTIRKRNVSIKTQAWGKTWKPSARQSCPPGK